MTPKDVARKFSGFLDDHAIQQRHFQHVCPSNSYLQGVTPVRRLNACGDSQLLVWHMIFNDVIYSRIVRKL